MNVVGARVAFFLRSVGGRHMMVFSGVASQREERGTAQSLPARLEHGEEALERHRRAA
jgi:hypothetical protein